MQNYHTSVTEREVTEGIINADNTKFTSLAFLRQIDDINMSDQRGGIRIIKVLYIFYNLFQNLFR